MEVAQSYMGQHDIYFTPKVRFGKFLCVIVRNKCSRKNTDYYYQIITMPLESLFFKRMRSQQKSVGRFVARAQVGVPT